ncbi:carboxymuconolactone decarboxylase (plasmid) [Acinetobacter sp. TGL-Y2]|uniref:carboxymuconolactone decarboxylase family protein n=1 Tax=Acinetobacter sp. TGL-Y2 TaxID=1407071 RepID=UPI0007A659B2|nr:carboxymuconolactone decarboxylase family protein [Acinetobacter sp. TGL-Y2]AMW80795.1 carboxymuconolactone decarboxylase [Acinetobacter sp. TGL-Y2]
MDYQEISKKTIGHLYSAHTSIRASSIEPEFIALAELYVSQINGCAYCCNFHSKELRDIGIAQDIIDKIPGYKHSNAFSNKQKIVLEFAKAITFLSEDIETIRKNLTNFFSEKEIVELTASISLMGTLNRLRIALGDKD